MVLCHPVPPPIPNWETIAVNDAFPLAPAAKAWLSPVDFSGRAGPSKFSGRSPMGQFFSGLSPCLQKSFRSFRVEAYSPDLSQFGAF